MTIAIRGVIELSGSLGGFAESTRWESGTVYSWIGAGVYRIYSN